MPRPRKISLHVKLTMLILVIGATIYVYSASLGAQWSVERVGQRLGFQLLVSPAELQLQFAWFSPPRPFVAYALDDQSGQTEVGHSLFGFLLGYRQIELGGPWRVIIHRFVFAMPWWFIACLAIAPRLERWARRVHRQRNRERTLCPDCGYDLRATPNVCPECGHVAGPADPF